MPSLTMLSTRRQGQELLCTGRPLALLGCWVGVGGWVGPGGAGWGWVDGMGRGGGAGRGRQL
jgi:hypothetical protein